MTNNKYKFRYSPDYSDLFYFCLFSFSGITIALLKHPWWIPFGWIILLFLIYLFLNQKSSIQFYENEIVIERVLRKKGKRIIILYSDISSVKYIFSEMGRGNIFSVTYLNNEREKTLKYTFSGNPTEFEIQFFRKKGILIKIVPESASFKIRD